MKTGRTKLPQSEDRTQLNSTPSLSYPQDSNGQRKADTALLESREQFLRFFGSAPMPVAVHDARGGFLQTNHAYQKLLGYAAEELVCLTLEQVLHPEDLAEGQRLHRELCEGVEEFRQREQRYLCRDGRTVWGRACTTVVRDVHGALRFVISMIQDVTELKRSEKFNDAFHSLGHRLSSAATPPEAARIIVETADQLFGWDACLLHLLSPQNEIIPVLTIDIVDGRRTEICSSTMTLDPSPMMERIIAEGPLLILRGEREIKAPVLVPFGDRNRPSASMLYVPIHSGSKVIGVLSIQSYTLRAYTGEDLRVLQGLADHCGGALERINAAEGLRKSEAEQRALLEAIPDWMFRLREDGTILDAKLGKDDGMSSVLCSSIGQTLAKVWPGHLVDLMMDHLDAALTTRSSQVFDFQYPVNGRWHDYEARVVVSGADEALVIVRDFSEQTRLENEVLNISSHEQQRIGRDLHDGLGQLLTGLGFLARSLEVKLAGQSLPEASEAAHIGHLASQGLAQMRTFARSLFPVELEAGGLGPALRDLARNVEKTFQICCLMEGERELNLQDKAVEEQLYRLAQEAVSNSIKHGKANRILLDCQIVGGGLRLTIRDNGVGITEPGARGAGMGVSIMHYRARRVGAELDIQRISDGGTSVTCVLPRLPASQTPGEPAT